MDEDRWEGRGDSLRLDRVSEWESIERKKAVHPRPTFRPLHAKFFLSLPPNLNFFILPALFILPLLSHAKSFCVSRRTRQHFFLFTLRLWIKKGQWAIGFHDVRCENACQRCDQRHHTRAHVNKHTSTRLSLRVSKATVMTTTTTHHAYRKRKAVFNISYFFFPSSLLFFLVKQSVSIFWKKVRHTTRIHGSGAWPRGSANADNIVTLVIPSICKGSAGFNYIMTIITSCTENDIMCCLLLLLLLEYIHIPSHFLRQSDT